MLLIVGATTIIDAAVTKFQCMQYYYIKFIFIFFILFIIFLDFLRIESGQMRPVKVSEKGVLSEEEKQLLMSKPGSKLNKYDGEMSKNLESLLLTKE